MDSYTVYLEDGTFNAPQVLLTIPVADASQYSTRPLKWIRYIVTAVVGCEGELIIYAENEVASRTPLPDNSSVNLDLEDATPEHRQLCFVPRGPIYFVDVDALSHLESSHVTTSSQEQFRQDIVGRDRSGVVNAARQEICDTYHLIPRSKGDEYIRALSQWRNQADGTEIESVNDIRNGVLVNKDVDYYFGSLKMGVLRTPNFALNADEVLPNPTYQNLPFRFTPHFYIPNISIGETETLPLYQRDFRYPAELVDGWPKDWPPAFLWDFIYGVLIVKRYGNKSVVDILNITPNRNFYPEGVEIATQRAKDNLARRKEDAQERKAHHREAAKGLAKPFDAFDAVLGLWMRSRLRPSEQKARAEAMERLKRREEQALRLTAERIDDWRQKVVNDDSK